MLPPVSLESALSAHDAFDRENQIYEAALHELREKFPCNTSEPQVLLKVVTLNQLYHARVFDKDLHALATHISGANLDPLLAEGSPDAVQIIRKSPCSKKYYSFATKYCCWHNRACYPMHDGYVSEALHAYSKLDRFAKVTYSDLDDYPKFVAAVNAFRTHYGLESLDCKGIDKFLWSAGAQLQLQTSAAPDAKRQI